MHRDTLTLGARRLVQSRILAPVIIRARPRALREIVEQIRPFAERHSPLLDRIRSPQALPITPLLKAIPRFNLVAAFLPREIIYQLADGPYAERIFPDNLQYAFQYPVVPPEGVYTAPHRMTEEYDFTTSMWVRPLVGADRANKQGFTGKGVLACVIDTGASRVHEQTSRVTFKTTMGQMRDENGHGTHVTSLLGGSKGRDEYLSQRSGKDVYCLGMAPECDLLAIKSLGYIIGMGSTANIIEAMALAIERKAAVVNMSLGGPSDTETPEEDAYFAVFDELLKEEIIPMVAAGNSGPGDNTIDSPGALPNVISVAATDPIKGDLAFFSSRGPTNWGATKPDLAAPGVMIDSGTEGLCDTAADGVPSRYSPLSGTSMATPVAAGVVTLMRQAHAQILDKVLVAGEVMAMMKQLGHEKSDGDGYGFLSWDLYEKWVSTEYGVEL